MADSRTTFIKRVISALLAGFALLGMAYYFERIGLYVACTIAIVLGIREYSRMAFLHWKMPSHTNYLYWAVSVLFYGLMIKYDQQGLLWFALCNALFFVGVLWATRGAVSNDDLLPAIAMGTFGMLYCVLFPFFAVRLVALDEGPQWFLFLLLVVFFGDTFAYFGGRFLGRHKLMPLISPNKTLEGCVAGLIGSALAGTVHLRVVGMDVKLLDTLVFCLSCGFAAQSGDLLISLVKRVAQVKDSGHIMPGHGGILDRLDGVFIACPLVYAFAVYVS